MNRKRFAALLTASMALRAFSYTVGNVPANYFLFGNTNNVCATSERNWVAVSRTSSGFQLTEETPALDFHATVSSPDKTVVGWGEAPEMNYRKIKWRINQSTTEDYTCTYDSSYTGREIYLFVLLRYLQYTLKFNANGGSAAYDQKDVCYTNSVALPVSERTGYSFEGWTNAHNTVALKDTVANLGEVLGVSNDCSDVYLFAKWTVGRYKVSFDANYDGGTSAIPSKMVEYDSQYGDLPQLTRNGYAFDGWYTAAEDGTRVYPHSVVRITDDQMLYAHWTPQAYRVTFDVNYEGGVISPAYTNIAFGTEYGALPQPTRAGYVFDGWYTMADGGNEVTSGTVMSATSAHTLYAHWTPLEYAVTFSAEGGEVSTSSITVTYGSAYESLPTPTRTGYKFDGWHTAANGGTRIVPSDSVSITSDQMLYAHWAAKMYKLYFDANGGAVSPASTMVTYGSSYENLPTPIRAGYTFNGWHTAVDGGSMVQATDKVEISDAQTLHAHWTANTYKVTFSANYEGAGSSSSTANVTYDSAYDALPTLKRNGYTFKGWYTAAEGGSEVTADTIMNIADTQTLYAHWSANKYTVTFDAHGGIGSMDNIELAYDVVTNLPSCEFEWTGYSFKGWDTNDAADVVVFSDGATVSNLTSEADVIVPLRAVWEANRYTVLFSSNGGVGTMGGAQFEYGTEANLASNKYTKTGYTFVGWATTETGDVMFADGMSISNLTADVDGSVTLYAVWSVNSYTIEFDSAGGSEVTSITNDYGTAVTAPAAPEKTGYTFAGWMPELPATMPASNSVLTAQWTTNSYTIAFDSAGGSKVTSITNDYGTAVTAPADPTKTGYTFAGWMPELPATMPASNSVLTAQWNPNPYTVTFNANHGEGDMSDVEMHMEYDTAANLPSNKYTKVGHSFAGWDTNDVADVVVFADGATVSNLTSEADGVVSLRAVWEPNRYTVSFSSNGGDDGTMGGAQFEYGTETNLPSNRYTKTGYTFVGWATNATENVADVLFGDEVAVSNLTADVDGSVTLHAVWSVNSYTIAFDSAGGSKVTSITNDYGTAVTAPADPTKTGYTFAGWMPELPATMPASNSVLTAQWTINSYTIAFDSAGGSKVTSITNDYGTAVTAPADPTKTGYTFAGWMPELPATMPASNSVVTAHWTTNRYTVTFDSNGGGGDPMPNMELAYDVVTNLDHCTFEWTGYSFESWTNTDGKVYLDCAAVSNLTAVSNGVVTLYAASTANVYTVTFVPDTGEFVDSTAGKISVTYNAPYGEFPEVVLGPQQLFLGWFTKESGTEDGGVRVEETDVVTNANDHVLYAHWTTEYSDAVNCTNLTLNCTIPNKKWGFDSSRGCDLDGVEDGSSSVFATNKATMTTSSIDGKGTLTFRALVDTPDIVEGDDEHGLLYIYKGDSVEYRSADTATKWRQLVCDKDNEDSEVFKWSFEKRADKDDKCWVDQVHWYPNKRVASVHQVIEEVESDITHTNIGCEIIEAVLQRWNNILGESASTVTSIDVKVKNNINAVDVLKNGTPPSPSVSGTGTTATLTFD